MGMVRFRSIVGSFGQERLSASEADLVHFDQGRWQSYRAPWQFFGEEPTLSDEFWIFQLKPRKLEVSPIYIATLRDCVVLPDGVILLNDGSVLLESVFPSSLEEFSRGVEARGSSDQYSEEQYARIANDGGAIMDRAVHCRDRGEGGYYHWLTAIMPRLELIQTRSSYGSLPHLIEPWAGFAMDWLDFVAPGLVVQRSERKAMFVRELIYASPAQVGHSHYARNPLLLQWFRQSLKDRGISAPVHKGGRRKLYITRSDAPMRRLVNEDALMDRLAPLGFERVSLSGMAVREQIQLFASASVIIGPHGAGLANVVFCEPETLVIELMSPTRTWPGFKVISGAAGARYAAYVAEAFDGAQTELVGRGNEDFTVRVDTCFRFVQACIS